ncbi:N-glycosylase/DNA lyase [Hyperthermus butylicus]|uniref:N-glycosylase/DNA lyase n=1 Tax=Hyperthermus butylicus (strain DSM 5456 / JCM 9403 / PLM1-5) TaxID=415426 RepID=A2BK00_HYPBU|nr:N-glycosylase/DNA lyase [Hyperthermus butylicus]ABM80311.1 hypothetical protein Hbut_0445 [Hyperthermus butylicus DSM 5456]
MYSINGLRVRRVGEALAVVSPHALDVIERRDPQYKAISMLAEKYGVEALAVIVANALISYRLTLKGEEYWLEFASYFSKAGLPRTAQEIVSAFRGFLSESRGNRRLVEQKLLRIRRAAPLLEDVASDPLRYSDVGLLVEMLARQLRARRHEKTIVFAGKMAYYLFKALNVEVRGLERIPLPVDRRVALITVTSGIADADISTIVSRPDAAIEAWSEIAKISSIPAMRLDAVIWLPAAEMEKNLRRGLEYARDEYARRLVSYSGGSISWPSARKIASEIVYRFPPNTAL